MLACAWMWHIQQLKCLSACDMTIPACFQTAPPPQVEAKVQDALAKGAVAACGGGRPQFEAGHPLAGGFFFEPTVLTGAPAPTCIRLPTGQH